uniref:C-type lectin domain-containing protein n=1 Tax=Caenorhabditis japonica TaxID=281687 RepID=A0A8R1ELK4_CAEJA
MVPISGMLILIFAFSLGVHAISYDSGSSGSDCDDDSGEDHQHHHHHHHHHHHYGGSSGENGGGVKKPTCPKGWTLFKRPNGGWCMRVFPTVMKEYAVASSVCASHGAVASGIQNREENTWIAQNALSTLSSVTGTLWIGAQRTPQCMGQGKTAACNEYTSFSWTDSSTTGTEGFMWLHATQPDNFKSIQNCAVLFYSSANVRDQTITWWPGAVDDVMCNPTQWVAMGTKVPRGILCGQAAKN